MAFKMFGRKKIGLALSGGGARGLAHIGVIKVLAQNDIPVDYICGTSVGALIGAIYAAGTPINKMMDIAAKIKWGNFFRIVLSKTGLVSSDEIEKFLIATIGRKIFEDLKISFSAIATDLTTGQEVIFNNGDLALAVRTSCSFPWMYIPVRHNGHLLVDGVLVNNLPTNVTRNMGADIVIGVDVIPRIKLHDNMKNVVDVFDRSVDVFAINQNNNKSKECDLLITPVKEMITSLELDKSLHLIKLGEEAAYEVLPEIKKLIS